MTALNDFFGYVIMRPTTVIKIDGTIGGIENLTRMYQAQLGNPIHKPTRCKYCGRKQGKNQSCDGCGSQF